ncbi:MAG TPA: LacI family DNA-binding transcriptional regulator [Chitinophagaceae bacterium]|nr:LacI family DNA-binding transcriptional regulator [Chitinophagaceae bacterium]
MSRVKDITIYDLARRLHISIPTLTRAPKDGPVVSKKTKKKIFGPAEEMGYRSNLFARNLRNQRTDTIGVIVPMLNSYFQSTVIAGIERVINREGYNLIITQSDENPLKEIAGAKTMFNNRVDGLLVSLSYDTDDLSHFEQFSKKNIPVIFFDRGEEHESFTNVLIDNRRAAYEATTHLISQGCRRILHITATSKRDLYIERINGFKQALLENELPFDENSLLYSNLSHEEGTNAADLILRMDPMPDAVFVSNDNYAAGCLLALKKAGLRIPEDIAIVGFNNDPVSKVVEPNLTTINNPGFEIGEMAANSLINHLKGLSPITATNTIMLRSELIIRASSLKSGVFKKAAVV